MNTDQYFQSLTDECETLKNRVRMFISGQHWQTDGEWKESVLRNMLRRSASETVTIGRGFVVTDQAASTQIDVLIYDNSFPILYRDGDLVFVTPAACRGIIEVKSKTPSPAAFAAAAVKLADNAAFIRAHTGDMALFVGYFSFESPGLNPVGQLTALSDAAAGSRHRIVDHACVGTDQFIKYWANSPDGSIGDGRYRSWHAYTLQRKAPGYFIHNALISFARVPELAREQAWFPIETKEAGLDWQTLFLERQLP